MAITISVAPADRTQGLLSTLSRPDTEVPPVAAWKKVSRTLTHSSRPSVPHPGTCPEQPGLSWALWPRPLRLHLLHPSQLPSNQATRLTACVASNARLSASSLIPSEPPLLQRASPAPGPSAQHQRTHPWGAWHCPLTSRSWTLVPWAQSTVHHVQLC